MWAPNAPQPHGEANLGRWCDDVQSVERQVNLVIAPEAPSARQLSRPQHESISGNFGMKYIEEKLKMKTAAEDNVGTWANLQGRAA